MSYFCVEYICHAYLLCAAGENPVTAHVSQSQIFICLSRGWLCVCTVELLLLLPLEDPRIDFIIVGSRQAQFCSVAGTRRELHTINMALKTLVGNSKYSCILFKISHDFLLVHHVLGVTA